MNMENKNKFKQQNVRISGGIMKRLFRLSILMVLLGILSVGTTLAQQVYVSGRVAPGDVRIFVKDSVYIIDRDYIIGGTLIIEPGTTVYFYPQGRIIDSTGGRIIADGYAKATYTQNPAGLNPVAPGSPYDGYSDPGYFLYQSGTAKTVNVTTTRDITVNPSKYNYIFNVVFDTLNKKIVDLADPLDVVGNKYKNNNNWIVVTFEQAIFWEAARLKYAATDVNIKMNPWIRKTISSGQIKFFGTPVNNFSREWGHFVILPGARAAFFRNVSFNGFRKDTTVDRANYYDVTKHPWAATVNKALLNLTNGSGGAITSFSSRTWLIDVTFKNNMARYRGGALQLLQAPAGYPRANVSLDKYPLDKNPNITDKDFTTSVILEKNPVLRIDNIDESIDEPLSDYDRMGYDDARIAVYLGRIRNLTFDRNYVQIANVIRKNINGILTTTDDLENPADYPQYYGNGAFGGALYIAGWEENRQIEIGLGINDKIKIGSSYVQFPNYDIFKAYRNFAANYQQAGSSEGARGGAIYVGEYTSLIVAGDFSQNETLTKFMQDAQDGKNSGYYSMGGAIYLKNTQGRLQVRGGVRRADYGNSTLFSDNRAGAGGAIYVDGNAFPEKSPIVGGTDLPLDARNYGFDIKFRDNKAITWGGAIFTNRNFWLAGSGGVQSGTLIGYDGNYSLLFDGNTAGFAGGAIYVSIPTSDILPMSQRTIQMFRTRFLNNKVGYGIQGDNRLEIRGGGAIYCLNGELNLLKGVEFKNNEVRNANGGAIAMINPSNTVKRYFLTDVDVANFDETTGLVDGYTSTNDIFTYTTSIPATVSMLTRFIDNKITLDADILESQSGSGATQIWQGTVEATEKLLGTYWTDANNGVAVGYYGRIIRYQNGGTKWTYPSSPTNYRLEAVTFTNASTGYIVGDRGTILKTENGGYDWRIIAVVPTDKCLKDVSFVGTDYGWAVSETGEILYTTNAGETWSKIQKLSNSLNGVFFKTNLIGYAVGDNGAVMRTANGGTTWEIVEIPGLKTDLNKVLFVNNSVGYIVGDNGIILKTIDGGNTWIISNSGTVFDLYSIDFYGFNVGYIVGQNGIVLKTTDGGTNWSLQDSKTTYNINDVRAVNNNDAFLVGDVAMLLGTNDGGATWNNLKPANSAYIDVKRYHQEINFPENGVGLGAGIYILDKLSEEWTPRKDSVMFNRVRFQGNEAYTGSAIYSDNYDLKLIFTRSLITTNKATSEIGKDQNYITGAVFQDANKKITQNFASSDLAGATIYGEVQGPLPSAIFSEAANSIYNNDARFLIRLPDAPNTKGILAGTTGIGFGGTDTLRGNYWGKTEADVDLQFDNLKIKFFNPETGEMEEYDGVKKETFFVAKGDKSYLPYLFTPSTSDPRTQGPFEKLGTQIVGTQEVIKQFTYIPVPAKNADGNENQAHDLSIPEKYLMSGHIYDIYDKGTDIKTADYSNRRMVPIEDFAVGIPPIVKNFTNNTTPSFGKYVKRWTRDPYFAELRDAQNRLVYPQLSVLQTEFQPNKDGEYYHPIGYPLYLEANVDYSGDDNIVNNDYHLLNETVFFVINETTGDYIRVPLKQVSEVAPNNERFWATVELVPDLSRRNSNPLLRRTAEGLANLGTGPFLLENLFRNPYKEDAGALKGRKYIADYKEFGTVPDLFINKARFNNGVVQMPTSNFANGLSNTTFFAGEKYTALPVNVGDVVRVISRTVLWREGANAAYEKGISFKITSTTEPPIFTGNIPQLENITPEEFKDKIFVSEDRNYPAPFGAEYSKLDDKSRRGRDSIIRVTAIDPNMFYDPRAWDNNDWSAKYAQLTYDWNVDQNSGLYRWLLVDTVKAADDQPRWGARGYLMFKGTPINPYVVPGGEVVQVGAANYPPHYRTLDSLKSVGAPQDVIDRFIETFKDYFSNSVYDVDNARFLQQDTIDFGKIYRRTKEFKMFVVDSVPRFLDPSTPQEELGPITVLKNLTTRETEEKSYTTSVYTCNTTNDGKLIANLTDKLRFQIDLNTDDELEDSWALNWNYPYGRTAYGFANISLRPNDDTTAIDTTNYSGDQFGQGGPAKLITQIKPAWMKYDYMYFYGKEDDASSDKNGADFTTFGKLNIRVPRQEAMNYLKAPNSYNNEMNTDTVFVVVANDGHGGVTFKRLPLFVNVQPQIVTNSLPAAVEGTDYNPQLLDTMKQIKIVDPNFGQRHRYELIYVDDARTSIKIDDCYDEAGVYDLTKYKTTPKWLKINKENGMLYGTPGVKDAPANITVTVVVTDENGLRHLHQIPMEVKEVNHDPLISGIPPVRCIDYNKPYQDYITIIDKDLFRNNSNEQLTIRLLDGRDNPITSDQLDVDPKVINGTGTTDSIRVKIFTNAFKLNPESDAKITIKVEVTDKAGKKSVMIYRLQVSLETDFVCDVKVTNSRGAYQILQFGTSSLPNTKEGGVTTGDGTDDPNNLGVLDYQLCEFELPPMPPLDVFDARWSIPLRNGTLRNIFPVAQQGLKGEAIYKARYQAGGETGGTSPFYPVTISWRPKDVPTKENKTANPTGATWYIRDFNSNGNIFSFEMTEPSKNFRKSADIISGYSSKDPEVFEITITNPSLNSFIIVHDWASDVVNAENVIFGINNVTPNPVTNNSVITFAITKPSQVKLDVVDAIGNVVMTLEDKFMSNGIYTINWDGIDQAGRYLPSGTYTIRMVAGNETSTYPVVVVR